MAEFLTTECESLNRVSVGDHFDDSGEERGPSPKRQRSPSLSDEDSNDSTAWYKNIKIVDVRSLAERRKVSTKRDNLPVYRLSPNPAETICASLHQNSSGQGLSEFRDSQCRSMVLSAIMVSTTLPVHTWTPRDMDAILRYGNRCHRKLTETDWKVEDTRLSLHMPVPGHETDWSNGQDGQFFSARQVMTVLKSEEYNGPVYSTKRTGASRTELRDIPMEGDIPMEEALSRIIGGSDTGASITVDNATAAVIRGEDGRIRYFDSQANNKIGRLNSLGTAVLLTFDTVRDLVRHIRRKNDNPLSRYEMIGLKAEVLKRIAVCRPIRRSS